MADDVNVSIKIDGVDRLKQAAENAARAADKLSASFGGGGGASVPPPGRGGFGGFGGQAPNYGRVGPPPPGRPPNPARVMAGMMPPPRGPYGGGFGNFGVLPNVLPNAPALYPAHLRRRGRRFGPTPRQQFMHGLRDLFFLSRAARLAAAAVEAMVRPMQEAEKYTRTFSAAAMSAGGAAGLGMGAAMGIGAGGYAGAANAFRQRLGSDPLAVMGFGRTLLPPQYGGRQDNAEVLREAIEKLARLPEERRLMRARQEGLEEFLPMTYASASARQASGMTDTAFDRYARSQRRIQADTELNWSMGAKSFFANRSWFNTLKFQASRAWAWWNMSGAGVRALKEGDKRGAEVWRQEANRLWSGKGGDASGQTAATLENTRALELLAGLLRGGAGVGGGGARTRAAIPPGLSGLRLEHAIEGDQLRLGGVVR